MCIYIYIYIYILYIKYANRNYPNKKNSIELHTKSVDFSFVTFTSFYINAFDFIGSM
jgi:hypothetical protein